MYSDMSSRLNKKYVVYRRVLPVAHVVILAAPAEELQRVAVHLAKHVWPHWHHSTERRTVDESATNSRL